MFVFDGVEPAVGDRTQSSWRFETHMLGPDMREHLGRLDFDATSVTTEVIDGRASAARLEVAHDRHTVDDRPLDRMSGNYLLRYDATSTIGSRADGRPLADHERQFFEDLTPPLSREERVILRRRAFRAGERFSPTPLEARLLGFGKLEDKRSIVVTVVAASAREMTFEATYEGLAKPPAPAIKLSVKSTVSDTVLGGTLDGVWLRDGKQAGSVHGTTRNRFTPAATSPRSR